MSYEIQSGLCATKGDPTEPDMTFKWDAIESGKNLTVSALFGQGTALNNILSVNIPWGSTAAVPIGPASTPISATGKVTVHWGDYVIDRPTSYVVTFSGRMVLPHSNDITSSDQNGVLADAAPIIVYAYLSGPATAAADATE